MMMMMDGQQEPPIAQLSSTYPSAPMEYVNLYTNENLKNGKAPVPPKILKENYYSFGKLIDPNEVLIMSLDSQGIERLYSLAPKPPQTEEPETAKDKAAIEESSTTEKSPPTSSEEEKKKEATVSSEEKSVEKPSSSSIGTHAINTNNHKRELKKLNHSILVAYLDLLDILVHAPNTQIEIEQPPSAVVHNAEAAATSEEGGAAEQPPPQPNVILKTVREQKLGDLELLFINMHHLINELRPHQARDTLRCILEMQRQQRIDMAAKFKDHLLKIVDILHNCIQSIEPKNLDKDLTSEIDTLLSNASDLSKSLDTLSRKKLQNPPEMESTKQQKATNGYSHKGNPAFDDDDVEMADEDAFEKKPSKEEQPTQQDALKQHSRNRMGNELTSLKNCDFRDLVLCDLIDEEFVSTLENEF